ncbi:hypothetical protein [Chryseobacterium sp.]|uniref:hypothetical protein n=1 Tax=Chryseobacterium sp. TaxID=1871047 RepID=UPI0031D33ACD
MSDPLSLEYLKGMLHTYGQLNMPDSNLWCIFDIRELEKSENEIERFRELIFPSKKANIELAPIEDYNNFKTKILSHWLFSGDCWASRNLDSAWKEDKTNSFYHALATVTQLKTIEQFIIDGYSTDGFGVHSTAFLITGFEKKYILYFIYDG